MDSQDGFCEYSREVENKNIFCTSINIHLSIVPALCNLNASLDIASATKYSKSDCEKINALKKGSWNVTAIEVEISICQKSSLHLLGFSQSHLWICFWDQEFQLWKYLFAKCLWIFLGISQAHPWVAHVKLGVELKCTLVTMWLYFFVDIGPLFRIIYQSGLLIIIIYQSDQVSDQSVSTIGRHHTLISLWLPISMYQMTMIRYQQMNPIASHCRRN